MRFKMVHSDPQQWRPEVGEIVFPWRNDLIGYSSPLTSRINLAVT
jgi:hypothetical protein